MQKLEICPEDPSLGSSDINQPACDRIEEVRA